MPDKKKTCIICKKTLIDEKIPMCPWCRMNVKEKVKSGTVKVCGGVMAGIAAVKVLANIKDSNKS